jgi:hypothetical protein
MGEEEVMKKIGVVRYKEGTEVIRVVGKRMYGGGQGMRRERARKEGRNEQNLSIRNKCISYQRRNQPSDSHKQTLVTMPQSLSSRCPKTYTRCTPLPFSSIFLPSTDVNNARLALLQNPISEPLSTAARSHHVKQRCDVEAINIDLVPVEAV